MTVIYSSKFEWLFERWTQAGDWDPHVEKNDQKVKQFR